MTVNPVAPTMPTASTVPIDQLHLPDPKSLSTATGACPPLPGDKNEPTASHEQPDALHSLATTVAVTVSRASGAIEGLGAVGRSATAGGMLGAVLSMPGDEQHVPGKPAATAAAQDDARNYPAKAVTSAQVQQKLADFKQCDPNDYRSMEIRRLLLGTCEMR